MNNIHAMVKEYTKCRDDIEYFANNYIYIKHPTQGKIKIELNDFQKEVIEEYKKARSFFKPGPRQSGKTAVAAIIMLHRAIFYDSEIISIISKKTIMSKYVLDIILDMTKDLPNFLCPDTKKRNFNLIEFENNSVISCASAELRGMCATSLSLVYIEEADFIDDLEVILRNILPCTVKSKNFKVFALSSLKTQELFNRYV